MKPENQYIQGVHKHIDRNLVYYEKTHNPYNSGTPDVYYEGDKDILWVEYKRLSRIPKTFIVKVTELQRKWLNRASNNNVNVAVITAMPDGAVVHTHEHWEHAGTLVIPKYVSLKSKKEVAEWIVSQCSHSQKL